MGGGQMVSQSALGIGFLGTKAVWLGVGVWDRRNGLLQRCALIGAAMHGKQGQNRRDADAGDT